MGSVTQNYSLEVSLNNPMTSLTPAVVTSISPQNSTLFEGDSGSLTCKVRSQQQPHIRWLKQVNGHFCGPDLAEKFSQIFPRL